MNSYELYRAYRALRLHFTTKYDFFEYNGAVRASIESFEKLPPHERRAFDYIASLKEPKTYLIGNFIFNESNYIRNFNNDHYMEYRKFLVNGNYIFEEDLKKLKRPLGTNFKVESEYSIPYIIYLLHNETITLFTACAFQRLFPWTDKIENPLLYSTKSKITKSYKFFKVDEKNLKSLIVNSNK